MTEWFASLTWHEWFAVSSFLGSVILMYLRLHNQQEKILELLYELQDKCR